MTNAPAFPRRSLALALILAGSLLALSYAAAAPAAGGGMAALIFTVNSTQDDPDDDIGDGECDTGDLLVPLIGPAECTLRAAIQESNFQGFAMDRIEFSIPGAGPHVIQPASALPQITEDVTIDGYTEPGAAVNTAEHGSNAVLMIEIDGEDAGDGASGLEIVLTAESGDVLIMGLAINNFGNHGLFTTSPGTGIEGNFIGTDVTGTAADGNGSWGVYIDGTGVRVGSGVAGRNVISGNDDGGIAATNGADSAIVGNLIGTNAAGIAALPNANGIELNASDHASVTGNVISGNEFHGMVLGNFAETNFIQGNLIGTDAAGTAAVPNGQVGISMEQTTDNLIGGTEAGQGNVISGNGLEGIAMYLNDTAGNSVVGNRIGTDVNGDPLGNGSHGLLFASTGGNPVGGTAEGEGNVIANNGGNGITVGMLPSISYFKLILGNSIYDNTGLGIDLDHNADGDPFPDGDGVTPNDTDDPDGGPNEGQNFPVIESAVLTADGLEIEGTLNSTASATFPLEFFVNPACDGSGHGEGQTLVGRDEATTDADGDATFSFTFPGFEPTDGAVITGTATSPGGSTSEFSACEELVDERPGPASPTPSSPGGTTTASPSAPGGSATQTRSPAASQIPNTADGGLLGLGGIGAWLSGALLLGSLAALGVMRTTRQRTSR